MDTREILTRFKNGTLDRDRTVTLLSPSPSPLPPPPPGFAPPDPAPVPFPAVVPSPAAVPLPDPGTFPAPAPFPVPGVSVTAHQPPPARALTVPAGGTSSGGHAEGYAVTGVHARFPGAPDLHTFWHQAYTGTSAAPGRAPAPGTSWRPRGGDGPRGRFLDGADAFDAAFFGLNPVRAALMDPQERLLLVSAWYALESAGYAGARLDTLTAGGRPRAVGVYTATGPADYALLAAPRVMADGPGGLPGQLSALLDLRGPSQCVDSGESSFLTALHLAVGALRAGECAAALVGAADLRLHPQRQGPGRAEAVGAWLLRPLAAARAAGDTVHAVIRDTATGHTGSHPAGPARSAPAARPGGTGGGHDTGDSDGRTQTIRDDAAAQPTATVTATATATAPAAGDGGGNSAAGGGRCTAVPTGRTAGSTVGRTPGSTDETTAGHTGAGPGPAPGGDAGSGPAGGRPAGGRSVGWSPDAVRPATDSGTGTGTGTGGGDVSQTWPWGGDADTATATATATATDIDIDTDLAGSSSPAGTDAWGSQQRLVRRAFGEAGAAGAPVRLSESGDSAAAAVGDTGAATGLTAAVRALLQLRHAVLLPAPDRADAGQWPRRRDEAGHELPRRAFVTVHATGGSLARILLEEAPEEPPAPPPSPLRDSRLRRAGRWERGEQEERTGELVLLSAPTPGHLAATARELAVHLSSPAHPDGLEAVARELRLGRAVRACRLAVVAHSTGELAALLGAFAAGTGPDGARMGTADLRSPAGPPPLAGELPETAAYLRALWRGGRLTALARLWLAGVDVTAPETAGPRTVAVLPGSPMERQSLWIGRTAPDNGTPPQPPGGFPPPEPGREGGPPAPGEDAPAPAPAPDGVPPTPQPDTGPSSATAAPDAEQPPLYSPGEHRTPAPDLNGEHPAPAPDGGQPSPWSDGERRFPPPDWDGGHSSPYRDAGQPFPSPVGEGRFPVPDSGGGQPSPLPDAEGPFPSTDLDGGSRSPDLDGGAPSLHPDGEHRFPAPDLDGRGGPPPDLDGRGGPSPAPGGGQPPPPPDGEGSLRSPELGGGRS